MSTTATRFDVASLRRAVEGRDAAAQLELYTADAELTIVDQEHPPSAPVVLRGRGEIGAYLADICGREMTHRVAHALATGEAVAWAVDCAYPDGARVRCVAVGTLSDGRIARQDCIQAWD